MKKLLKVLLVILILAGLGFGGYYGYKHFFNKDEKAVATKEAKKLDSIKGFNYTLYDKSNDLYKDLYYELKEVLESETIDYQKYAELVAKMFVADFYTLDNKVTNHDIGGLDFIYSTNKQNFALKASDTLYKYVENNVYGERKQTLPVVESFVNVTVTKEIFNYSSSKDADIKVSINDPESYVAKISWKYKDNLKYQTSATIRLVHEDKVLSIVSVQ